EAPPDDFLLVLAMTLTLDRRSDNDGGAGPRRFLEHHHTRTDVRMPHGLYELRREAFAAAFTSHYDRASVPLATRTPGHDGHRCIFYLRTTAYIHKEASAGRPRHDVPTDLGEGR